MTDFLYFLVGSDYPTHPNYELWKYDGINPPTLVYGIDNTNGSSITCLKYSTNTKKLYFHVDDFDHLTVPNGNSQSSIYELNPANDSVRLIITYSFTDIFNHNNQPCGTAFEDNGFIYWVQQLYTSDEHITKFDPVLGTVTLVSPILPGTTSGNTGFLTKVGIYYYWADAGQIRRTTTIDIAGSWTLWWDAFVLQEAQFISNGDFLGTDYYFGATLDFGVDGRGNNYRLMPEVFKIDAAGTRTKVYQNDDQGITHPPDDWYLAGCINAQVINNNNVLRLYTFGISNLEGWNGSSFVNLQSTGIVFNSIDGVTWTVENIPYSTYLAQNYDATCGPQGGIVLTGSIYIVEQYNDTIGMTGFGVQLIKRDAGGIWSIIHNWNHYQLLSTTSGPDCQIALVPATITPTPVTEIVTPYCPTRAWVILYDTTGKQLALFDDWKDLQVTHKINNYDDFLFSIDGMDSRVNLFGVDYILEVWREVGTYVYIEATGLVRTFKPQLTTDQHSIFTAQGRGLLDLIARRLVLYQSETIFTFKSGPGETVIKQIVNENAGPLGNTIIRYSNGQTQGLSIQPDSAQGKVWTNSTGNQNVLKLIQEISQLTGVDFDLILTSKQPVTFEFRCYYPQRGNNLSATVAFSPLLGNMVNAVYTNDYSQETNVVVVLGPGTDGSRLMLTGVGPDIGASPWNKVESTTSASGLPNISGLSNQFVYEAMQAALNLSLTNNQPRQEFTFDVLQTDIVAYGRDYKLGDIVTARFGSISLPLKIVEASLQIKEGQELIKLAFANLPTQL